MGEKSKAKQRKKQPKEETRETFIKKKKKLV